MPCNRQLLAISASGQPIQSWQGLKAGSNLQVGAHYRPGMFILEATQGAQRVTVKIIKQ